MVARLSYAVNDLLAAIEFGIDGWRVAATVMRPITINSEFVSVNAPAPEVKRIPSMQANSELMVGKLQLP
jgi:hypothetical protein